MKRVYEVTFKDNTGRMYFLHTFDLAAIGPWLRDMAEEFGDSLYIIPDRVTFKSWTPSKS